MFEPTSRYFSLENATLVTSEGNVIAYKRRRFLPRADSLATIAEVSPDEGDRLDIIASKTLGDPEQYWRICDANNAMRPTDLTERPGLRLRVPFPQG